jgi:hypothetical protein
MLAVHLVPHPSADRLPHRDTHEADHTKDQAEREPCLEFAPHHVPPVFHRHLTERHGPDDQSRSL